MKKLLFTLAIALGFVTVSVAQNNVSNSSTATQAKQNTSSTSSSSSAAGAVLPSSKASSPYYQESQKAKLQNDAKTKTVATPVKATHTEANKTKNK